MKKTYQIVISILLLFVAFLAILYWEPLLDFFNIDTVIFFSILMNIFAYIGRVITLKIIRFVLGTKKISAVAIFIVNLIWIGFIFELILTLSLPLGVAIISFLVVSISLTFRERIDNIASGFMLLSSSNFQVGDLIETNDVQGIVSEISLNYTKLRNFMGIVTYFPNTNIYNASIKRFTQNLSQLSLSEEEIEDHIETRFQGFPDHLSALKCNSTITHRTKPNRLTRHHAPKVSPTITLQNLNLANSLLTIQNRIT